MRKGKYDHVYMENAESWAAQSGCPRKKVGCVILLESGVLATGFNGHASGGPNEWEDSGTSNPEVVHAELNALGKCLEEGLSAKGATVFVTLSPCLDCAKLLVRSKVARVVYKEQYRIPTGIDYLIKYGVEVEQYDSGNRNCCT